MTISTPTKETAKDAAGRLMKAKKEAGYLPEALHTYTDAEGNSLYWRIRMKHPNGEKLIRPMCVIDGEYQLKEPDYPNGKPLYNLHLLKKRPDDVIWLVEGEKCADALTQIGLLATTSGSADSVDRADWQSIAGREVIIWPDNDNAGLEYAKKANAALCVIACKTSQLDIRQLNLPVKGDCVDWLQQFKETQGRSAEKADIDGLALKPYLIQSPTNDYLQTGDAIILAQSDDEVIARLATLKPLEYDRLRVEQAKALGVRPDTLDKMVKAERNTLTQDKSPFREIEPWHDAINPAQLLDEISDTIQRFIVLEKHQAQAAALWVTACWFIDVISFAPFALINAPERACGKTQFLTLMGRLAPRTLQASGISPAALYRTIEKYQPTLFIDEIETVLKDNEPLRGIFNAGYSRDSSIIVRCVGDELEPKPFNIWGMKSIAGINAIKLSDTVTSRSIVFELRRKTASEKVERLRRAETGLFENLASKLARFCNDYANDVKQTRPVLPETLGDREQDNWEPLLQIALVAGGHWPNTAINAALKLAVATLSSQSTANELLMDIKEIFDTKRIIKITTTDLINALCEDPEKSWSTFNRGKQLSPRQLSGNLKGYGIKSKTIRINTYETQKGYEFEQFQDAFARYLSDPMDMPSQSNILQEANKGRVFDVTDAGNVTVTQNTKVTLESLPVLDCDVVTDKVALLASAIEASNKDDVAEF